FEDEHFWESTYPFIFAAEKFAGGEAEVTEFAKLTGSPFRRVLDLCCGSRQTFDSSRQTWCQSYRR
ncbi:MAG TPA: hypothetical protein VF020_08395, partial [Chthoniobacterales bacterium]